MDEQLAVNDIVWCVRIGGPDKPWLCKYIYPPYQWKFTIGSITQFIPFYYVLKWRPQ
jgi:hypothetical protein